MDNQRRIKAIDLLYKTFGHIRANGIFVPLELAAQIYALKFEAGMGIEDIQAEYEETLIDVMTNYIDSDSSIVAFRNEFRRAANDAFNLSAVAGWADGGGSGAISEDLQNWVNSEIESEIANIDSLFADLRELRKEKVEGETEEERSERIDNVIASHAAGYTGTLVGVYNYAEMVVQGDRPGMWQFGDTVEHCSTCAELDGQVHPLSWYVENDYVPQQNGSATLECGGWHCLCTIVDPDTGDQLVP